MTIDKQKTQDQEEEERLASEINFIGEHKKGFKGNENKVVNKQLGNIMSTEKDELNGGVGTTQTLMINDNLIEQIESTGFSRSYIIQSLNNDELNYATSFYYLLSTVKEF